MVATVARTNAPDTRQPEDRKQKLNEQTMPLMPVNAASIIVAKPVAYGVVTHRIECCCTFKTRLLLFEQHPHFVQRRSHASGYRRPCSSRVRVWSAIIAVWAHSPLFQGWPPPLLQLDGASVLVLHLDRRLVFIF